MAMLIAGVTFWSLVHLFPAMAPNIRGNLVGRFGEGPYKGLFALDIAIALSLIIFGWKSAIPAHIYSAPMVGHVLPGALMILAILFLVVSGTPNNIKRYIRHPQMTAVLLWSTSHLLSNGDSRSVVLFGGLAIWSMLEMLFINRRDGAWQKPPSQSLAKDTTTIVIAAAAFAALLYLHSPLFGVPATAALRP